MNFVMNKDISRAGISSSNPLNKPRHLPIGKTLFPQKMKLKSLNLSSMNRHKGGKKRALN
jgi:hypothetical protein